MLVFIAGLLVSCETAAAWLTLLGCVLFVIESLIDCACGVWSYFEPKQEVGFTKPEVPGSCLDRVDWDLLASIFFLIPSLIFVFQSLLDTGLGSLCIRMHGVNTDALYGKLYWWADTLFVFDALLRLIGRWRVRMQTAPSERLVLLQVCAAEGILRLDWTTWGDVLFLVGSLVSISSLAMDDADNTNVALSSDVLWAIVAVLYLIGCICLIQEERSVRDRISRRPSKKKTGESKNVMEV